MLKMPFLTRSSWIAPALVAVIWPHHGTRAAGTAPGPVLAVTCAPERSVVHPGEKVTARVWAVLASGEIPAQQPILQWSVSHGIIAGSNSATWSLPADVLGPTKEPVTATASIRVAGGSDVACSFTIQVATAPARVQVPEIVRGILSVKAQLPRSVKRPEEDDDRAGYGLYGYLLFGGPARDDLDRARYTSAIRAYLQELSTVAELENHRARSQLNITFLPVKEVVTLPAELNDAATDKVVGQLLAGYDYARAKDVLDRLGGGKYTKGPYLVAMPPAQSTDKVTSKVMLDMSAVTPSRVSEFVRTFCWLVQEERSWDEVAMRKLSLNVRNVVAITARRVPEMIGQIPGLLRVSSGP